MLPAAPQSTPRQQTIPPVRPIVTRRVMIIALAVGFSLSWLLLFAYFVRDFQAALFAGPTDVARRLTAPNGQKTALLVRDYHFDLNFRLYMVDSPRALPPSTVQEALWSSPDYNPVTDHNWYEELEWSADSSVVAVRIEQQYMFAYDFATSQEYTDSIRIRQLMTKRAVQPNTMGELVLAERR